MSTRAQVRFATREEGVSFSEHPDFINAQFYVHYDGYPEGLGVEIAESLMQNGKIMNWEIERLDAKHSDIEYIYYIWQDFEKSTWISIFETRPWRHEEDKCIFVGEPSNLINKYKLNTDTNG